MLVNDLKDIWIAGDAYVGDLPTIFESYQSVPPEDKERVKLELMGIYEEMKKVHPQIQSVNWSR